MLFIEWKKLCSIELKNGKILFSVRKTQTYLRVLVSEIDF